MSSILDNSNIVSGDTDLSAVYGRLREKVEQVGNKGEVKYASKIARAEFLHRNEESVEGEGLLSKTGTSGFKDIIQGAKQEIDKEIYDLGKAMFVYETLSDIEGEERRRRFADKSDLKYGENNLNFLSDDIGDWFETGFDDTYSAEAHEGVNPEYVPMNS